MQCTMYKVHNAVYTEQAGGALGTWSRGTRAPGVVEPGGVEPGTRAPGTWNRRQGALDPGHPEQRARDQGPGAVGRGQPQMFKQH